MSEHTLKIYTRKFYELRTIFDSLPDGIVAIIDKDMKIAAANQSISNLFNLTLPDIVEKSVKDIIKHKSAALYEVIEQTINRNREVRNYTIEFTDDEERIRSFLVSSVVIKELNQKETGIVLILHDVSEISSLRKAVIQIKRYGEIIGDSGPMKNIYDMIDSIKNFDTSVLLIGETGTGKELVARSIHQTSNRRDKPFIPINCSALPPNLIESELFGHVKGAFTGASTNRPGRFRLADGGTLFLDEIGTLSLELQVKLLRVLQQKVIEPVGSSQSLNVDVRIISASNRDLSELVKNKEFREDLLYRLKVFQITLPPLRQRLEDIPLLTDHFIERLNHYYTKKILGISSKVMDILKNYSWPGNVRELENVIEHAFVLTPGSIIDANALPMDIQHFARAGKVIPPALENMNLLEEKIRKALISSNGNIENAAEILEMHRSTLWRKMKEFRIPKGFGKFNK